MHGPVKEKMKHLQGLITCSDTLALVKKMLSLRILNSYDDVWPTNHDESTLVTIFHAFKG